MIESFVASWPLFHDVYVAGVLMALLLSLVGVAVVVRDQVFLGAAVSQASMLGIAAGIQLGALVAGTSVGWLEGDTSHSVLGGIFAVVGSLAVAAAAPRIGETREGLTGWLFLAGSSVSVLLVSNSPHGMAEVNRLLASSIIGATTTDVAVFTILLAVTVGVVALRARPLLLLLTDPETARVCGIDVVRWDRAIAVWLAVAVAWSIHVSGIVFTFGCLVLPALVAKRLVHEARSLFFVAPAVALIAAATAFVVANAQDLPPGQLAVAILCAAQALAWLAGRRSGAS
jgi:ABC-type Mn2+/Zn2+ transport system permease subunit